MIWSCDPRSGDEVVPFGDGRSRAFAIAGPSSWNSLQDPVRNPNATRAAFRRLQ